MKKYLLDFFNFITRQKAETKAKMNEINSAILDEEQKKANIEKEKELKVIKIRAIKNIYNNIDFPVFMQEIFFKNLNQIQQEIIYCDSPEKLRYLQGKLSNCNELIELIYSQALYSETKKEIATETLVNSFQSGVLADYYSSKK